MPTCPFCNESNPADVGVCKKCGGVIPKEELPQGELSDFDKEILMLMKGGKKDRGDQTLPRENRPGTSRRRRTPSKPWGRNTESIARASAARA